MDNHSNCVQPQMMFASITPLLMTGAFAERVRYRSFVFFTVLWEILVYYPVAHWIWGGGWMARLGVQDFAGGIVIHTTAGVGSLIAALGTFRFQYCRTKSS
jgi:Amt family ammonium transporter